MAGKMHIKRWCHVGLVVGFVFAHIRAYAIRPYTCSIIVVAEYSLHLHLFDANRLCLPTKKSGQHTGVMTAKYL